MEIVISSSTNKNKKLDAVIDGNKKISFGASGYSDFTKHQDLLRRDPKDILKKIGVNRI